MRRLGCSVHGMRPDQFANIFLSAAKRRGIPCNEVEVLGEPRAKAHWTRIDHPNGPFLRRKGVFQFVSRLRPRRAGRRLNQGAEAICSSRGALRAVLMGQGLPVWSACLADAAQIDDALQTVCDPSDNAPGFVRLMADGANGLTGDVRNAQIYDAEAVDALRAAALEMIEQSEVVSLEPLHPGQHIYVYLVGGIVQATQRRAPPSVTGDGVQTIYQLISARNSAEDTADALSLRPALMRALDRQGLKLTDRPEAGQRVQLGQIQDGASGYEVGALSDPLDRQHDGALAQLAKAALTAVGGMPYGAVELFAPKGACLQSGADVVLRNVIPYADPAPFCAADADTAEKISDALLAMLGSDEVWQMTPLPNYAPSALDDADPDLRGIDPEARAMARELAMAHIPYQVATYAPEPDSEPINSVTFQLAGHEYSVANGAIRIMLGDGARGHINGPAVPLTSDKSATKALLKQQGLNAPEGRTFQRSEMGGAMAYAQDHFLAQGIPVCIKPAAGHGGILVFTKCATEAQVTHALEAVFRRFREAIVEQTVSGEDVRFIYVEPNIVGTLQSVRADVTGDGCSTILQLLKAFNDQIPSTGRLRNVACGADLVHHLFSQSLQLESVPAVGQQVSLSPINYFTTYLDGTDSSGDIHPEYYELAKSVFAAIPGLRIGAMDTIIGDRTQPATGDNWHVLEINSSPGITTYTQRGTADAPQPYAKAVIDLLRRKGDEIQKAASEHAFEKEVTHSDEVLAEQIDASLAALETMPAEFLAETQMDALVALVEQAKAHSPFYRDHLKDVFVNGAFSPDAWLSLPILQRRDVRLLGDRMHCDTTPEGGEVSTVSTSGSSGSPLTVRWNRMATLATRSVTQRMYRWHGFDMAGSYAGIRSYGEKGAAFPGMRRQRSWNTFNPDAPFYSLSVDTPMAQQLDWLGMIRPDYLNTYPSVVAELARLGLRNNEKLRFDYVLTAGEVVTPEIRALCQEAFGARILDSYGCQEFGKIAVQCEHEKGRLHICTSNVLVEVLDENNQQVLPGQSGRVVLTSLYNYAMPFIRYEIGDYVTLADSPCPCGRSGPTIEQVHGRRRNMIVLPNGDRRWIAGRTLSDLAKILGASNLRLVQTHPNRIEVEYEATATPPPGIDQRLTDVLRASVHPLLSATSVAVAQLQRSASGKFEDVVGLEADWLQK